MRSVITAIAATIVVLAAVAWLAIVIVAQTGAINVAATQDYVPGVEWFFSTLSESSIRRQAARALATGEIQPPGEVTEAMLRTGSSHFQSMCTICHGAPGVERGEIGKGLKPKPPDLSEVAREMSSAEIYWVLQNGIRHTGMPSFGATHSTEDLRAVTAFVERLADMSPEEYRRLTAGSQAL